MSSGRHSYIAFYPSDWIAGTAGMPRIVASVYHDICLYNWDKAAAMSLTRFKVMTSDLPPEQAQSILQLLIDDERVIVESDMIYSTRALEEAQKAYNLWEAKSRGGRNKTSKKPEISKPKKLSAKSHAAEESLDSSLLSKDNNSSPPSPSEEDLQKDQEDLKALEKIQKAKQIRENLNNDVKTVAEAWNAMAASCSLPSIESMSDKRKTGIVAHLEKHGLEKVLTAIKSIPRSKFLLGKNDRQWRATFDPWFIRPDSCAKLIEGVYHAEVETKPKPDAKPLAPIVDVEGEPEVCGKIRRQMLATIGIPSYCAFANGVKMTPEPESRAIRIDGPTAVRLKDDYGPLLKKIIAPLGYSEIW